MRLDLERLDAFLRALSHARGRQRIRHVIEFRHPSWYVEDTFRLLDRRGVALCLHDKEGSAIDHPFVGPFVYVRFHGPSGTYHGSYGAARIDTWARRLAERARAGQRVFAYFNNDPDAAAVGNAISLRSALQKLL